MRETLAEVPDKVRFFDQLAEDSLVYSLDLKTEYSYQKCPE
jgi:hypothetical protein